MRNEITHLTEYLILGKTDVKDKQLLSTTKSLTEAFKASDNYYTQGVKDIKIIRKDYEIKSKTIFEIETRNLNDEQI